MIYATLTHASTRELALKLGIIMRARVQVAMMGTIVKVGEEYYCDQNLYLISPF